MLRLIGNLNEGSLLRRTLLHVAVFVAGSASFVALVSVLLVTTAKAVLPSHTTSDAAGDATNQEQGADPKPAPSSPEASVGAPGAPKAFAQLRTAGRRDGATVQATP